MKLLKTVIFGILFLLGVFLSSANTALMEVVYLPPVPFGPMQNGASVQLPVFIVILGAILIGVLATGLGVAVEQSKLRWSTRSALKTAKKQEEEWQAANDEVAAMKEQVANANSETERLRAKLRETESEVAKLKGPGALAAKPSPQAASTRPTAATDRPASKPSGGAAPAAEAKPGDTAKGSKSGNGGNG